MTTKNQTASKEQATETKRALPMGAKATIAAGAMAVLLLFGACDTGSNPKSEPKLCECPPGTTHALGEQCCDGENCACEEEQPPILCECPEGTFHDEGEACCEGENCNCKEAYNVFLGAKQIRVEDTTGLANKEDIQSGLDLLDSMLTADPYVAHFKSMNTNPIMVIENTHNLSVENNKFFMGIDEINADATNIYNAIAYIYNVSGTPLMETQGRERKGD
jgi:hypothetical protein